ncbi:hypothetical protein BGW38_006326 [Lunasporangiospora selenospora]|uniref:Uncharacterized protein n=1 Tax=Lunasporangiospora selenospora TaxID=979761 RepID=A0A9P6G0B2_9FUNG|nr:hypothetical protein BGW38_006326 [Lunasporangiospora selenospora]
MGAMALAFTNVQDLSIAYRDIAGQGLHILDPDRDRLTSLRITGWTGHTPLLVQTVHEYLLKAKHLLEFRGLHVHFHLPMMDLEGRLTGASVTNDLQETIEVYYPRYAPQRRTVWACRQLEVLSLTVDETWTHPNRARYMRTLFGYLVRVCPNLKQLHIRRRLVRLDYWSGLCLLTRLKHLRRLDVECQELVVVVSAKEEGVVRKTPKLCRAKTVFNRCMRLVQPSLRYDPSEDRPPLAAFGSWPGEPRAGEPGFGIVDGIDMSQLGRRQDVKDHVRERARVDAPIWPDLELLQIRYTYGQLDGLEKAVQACKTGIRTELIREDWVE